MTGILRFTALLLTFSAAAQTAPLPQPLSVSPDHSITFRYFDPSAKKVVVSLDLYAKPLAMTRDAAGEWSLTTEPLTPNLYGYTLVVDGTSILDPLYGDVRKNYVYLGDQVLVPATPPAPWELTAIPHGRVDHVRFTTHIVRNLPAAQSAYAVYTPPGYDAQRKGGYPVLYLLHGWSDPETAWVENGRADMILDSLIAEHKAVPMIVVMPLGYGDLDFVQKGFSVWHDGTKVAANTALFTQSLLTEVLPAVERGYNVAPGRENRAIAGLSMGGLESLTAGLNHTGQFAWVAGMSAAVFDEGFDTLFTQLNSKLDPKTVNLRLLWIACGADEPLLKSNRDLVAWTRAHGLTTTAVEIPGGHTWLTWRDNLLQLAPLLFQPK